MIRIKSKPGESGTPIPTARQFYYKVDMAIQLIKYNRVGCTRIALKELEKLRIYLDIMASAESLRDKMDKGVVIPDGFSIEELMPKIGKELIA